MDRLQSLGIPPATAPGVVPGLLGIAFIIFGSILLVRREPGPAMSRAGHRGVADATAPADAIVPAGHADELDWKRWR